MPYAIVYVEFAEGPRITTNIIDCDLDSIRIGQAVRLVFHPSEDSKLCIKGTRVPASVIVGSIADGDTPEQIIDAWPQLTGDDIEAAVEFAAESSARSGDWR